MYGTLRNSNFLMFDLLVSGPQSVGGKDLLEERMYPDCSQQGQQQVFLQSENRVPTQIKEGKLLLRAETQSQNSLYGRLWAVCGQKKDQISSS